METVSLRLLPYAEADGPSNMAADEALLQSAAAGGAFAWPATNAPNSSGAAHSARLIPNAIQSLPLLSRACRRPWRVAPRL